MEDVIGYTNNDIDNDDEVLLRDLPVKYNYTKDDMIIVEGRDGTRLSNLFNTVSNVNKDTIFFDTVSDLLNTSSELLVGSIVFTLGYYYKNDGGGARYYISNEFNVANGTTVHQLSKYPNLRAYLIMDDDVYVEQFGAKGDGSTDDSMAITKAFTHHKNIKFHDKRYFIGSTINVPSNVDLCCNCTFISNGSYIFRISNSENVSIRKFTMELDTSNGILISNSSNVQIESFNIGGINTSNSGIVIESSSIVDINNFCIKNTSDLGYGISIQDSPIVNSKPSVNINISNFYTENLLRGIYLSTVQDIGTISINNGSIKNKNNDNLSCGIYINSNCDIRLNNIDCDNSQYLINVYHSVISNIEAQDIYTNNVKNVYSINTSNEKSNITLLGSHEYISNNSAYTIFDVLNCILNVQTNSIFISKYKPFNDSYIHVGKVRDMNCPDNYSYFYCTDAKTVTESDKSLKIANFSNTVINLTGGANLNSISRGIYGQIILLVSSDNTGISKTGYGYDTLDTTEDHITLHKYKGIKLMYTDSGKWVQIQ